MCAAKGFDGSRIVVVSGGSNLGSFTDSRIVLESVEIYSIKNDFWSKAPSLNEKRWYHSTCSLGYQTYVLCGTNGEHRIRSIERLDLHSMTAWDKLEFPDHSAISVRMNAVAVAVGENEICLLGGMNGAYCSDGYIINVKEMHVSPLEQPYFISGDCQMMSSL